MRIHDTQERFADLGEIVVDLEVHARGEEGEAFEQALDVRVGALVGLEQQARRDLGVALGEGGAGTAEEGELLLVVSEQLVTHRPLP